MLRQKIKNGGKSTLPTGHSDSHGHAMVQYEAHHLMQYVQGYTGSLWMPPLVNYLLRVALTAARVTGKQMTMKKCTYFAGRFDGHGNAPICVGTFPQGYVRNVPLPRVPVRQSPMSQVHTIPDSYEVLYVAPMYTLPQSIVENAAYAFSPAWHAIAINT
jgi:hypothetical protein